MANKIPPTLVDFQERFPEFEEISVPIIQANLDMSNRLLDSEAWGDLFFDAVCFDTAHSLCIAALAQEGGASGGISAAVGQVTSSSGAGMSTSFSQMPINDKSRSEAWYSKTVYGQMFLRLKSVAMPAGALCA